MSEKGKMWFMNLGYKAFFFLFLVLVGCASKQKAEPFQSRVYVGKMEEVWGAALKAMADYPLKFTNKDTGRLQTETVNGPYNELFFTYPEPIELPERFRYSLKLSFAKLKSEDYQPLVRIRVIKELERFHDFYTGWSPFASDGIEEKILLYRIEHYLRMDRLLSDAAD
jgi:hypothetical protein